MLIWQRFRDRLALARFDAAEASGSLGDLGTFLPLVLGMARQNGLDLGMALFFAGLLNLLTGLAFSIPMAVQPMKAIAAVALTQGLTVPQILAAGMIVSAVVTVLGLLGWVDRLGRAIPDSVVRGMQLGLGLSLALKGLQMVGLSGADRWWLALPAALFGWWFMGSRRVPVALVIFGGGLALALFRSPEAGQSLRLGLHLPHWIPIPAQDWWIALTKAALPQIPLTLLNSVVAVCALARDLHPDRAPSEKKVAVSVGAMNLLTGWFGGMPMCHGAGGLAGQEAFGARTQGSILMLGAAKVAVAVLFGSSLMALALAFPQALLGVMLVFSGISLAEASRKATDFGVLLITAAGCIALGYLPGVVLGTVASLLAGRRTTRV
jgi:MFS superfamily sulfate permease-like transporter